MASNDTMQAKPDSPGVNVFVIEFQMLISTGTWRSTMRIDRMPKIRTMKTMFSIIELTKVSCEVRQNSLIGDGDDNVTPDGHIFVALIPTARDADSFSGNDAATVSNVPAKSTFPLHGQAQNNHVFNFDLSGYELDLGQDPRRGQGPVFWCGNTGVASNVAGAVLGICSITWRIEVQCSGISVLF